MSSVTGTEDKLADGPPGESTILCENIIAIAQFSKSCFSFV